jgi:hypothetical protein
VTLGQYLRPTPKHAPVDRYVPPETFDEYRRFGEELGFAFVASGPLVRSSYHAAEGFVEARLRPGAVREASSEALDPLPPSGPPLGLIRPDSLVRRTRVTT